MIGGALGCCPVVLDDGLHEAVQPPQLDGFVGLVRDTSATDDLAGVGLVALVGVALDLRVRAIRLAVLLRPAVEALAVSGLQLHVTERAIGTLVAARAVLEEPAWSSPLASAALVALAALGAARVTFAVLLVVRGLALAVALRFRLGLRLLALAGPLGLVLRLLG